MPRKPIRLPAQGYVGGNCFSVTIATYYRKRIFEDAAAADVGLTCLRQAARRYGARVYAYCFMPDHVHLLAQTPPGTNFTQFVNRFKESSGIALRDALQTREAIWQPRFYDHGLRSDESLVGAAEYIFHNPVRAGLAAAASEYRFSGSLDWPNAIERAGQDTSEPNGTGLHADVRSGEP